MRDLKLIDRFKSTQVHAVTSSDNSKNVSYNSSSGAGGKSNPISSTRAKLDSRRIKSFGSRPKFTKSISIAESLILSYGLPSTDTIEPSIDPCLKPVNLVETLADLYDRFESCSQPEKTMLCMEQYTMLRGVGDSKILRRCLRTARQNAIDVLSKVVLSAWLRFERREDELVGATAMDCGGHALECPKANLISGYNPCSINEHCQCMENPLLSITRDNGQEGCAGNEWQGSDEENDVSISVNEEEINCVRYRIAALSEPLKAMLFGSFAESTMSKIDFSRIAISVGGMRAVEMYSRTKRVDLFCPKIVLELLCFANRFCCEEMKADCDAHLASFVGDVEEALILIEYGLQEMANLLVASCLQVLLRDMPNSLYSTEVVKIFCSFEVKERLAMMGYDGFLMYYFLSQVALEESMVSNTTVMLLDRMGECAKEKWQKALAFHQLGFVLLERKEYKNSQLFFEIAAEVGHVYSIAGQARAKLKQGQPYSAYKMISSLIFEYKAAGWMYQERSLYNIGREKVSDLETATKLDPCLSFPYKYRAVAKLEEKQMRDAILEIDKIIRFQLSPDCLELRAWFYIALEDYDSAIRDIRALLTLEPGYIMFNGKVKADYVAELLNHQIQKKCQADCWMQLFEHWSSVDDIGSLAIIHHMLENEPQRSLLEFRQSLLLLRLNSQKAAMRCLRLARNHSSSLQERLVYEGWILYDTGYHDEALSRANESIVIQRSFEAFFLKAYVIADRNLDHESSSYVIHLLEEALKCPSDGLRKGQALNNLGSIYVDCGKLDQATECYKNALAIKHTRAHQGLARIHHLKNQRKAAYDEMTKLIEIAEENASAYEKRSEYCDRDLAMDDLNAAIQLDPLRTYSYRYRAAVMMDDQRETEAIDELTKALEFKPDLQMLHLRAAFSESVGDISSALRDCQAALCLDPNHTDTLDLYNRTRD